MRCCSRCSSRSFKARDRTSRRNWCVPFRSKRSRRRCIHSNKVMTETVRGAVMSTAGLGLRIRGVTIVDDVSLDVNEGEFLVIIGPNGAGKTTLFNLLSGVTRPSSGRVTFRGTDITYAPPYVRARLGLGRTFQTPTILRSGERRVG